MSYILAADFRERTVKPHTANIALTESDGSDPYLDLVIAAMTTRVELDLNDDFEPPSPDNDETINIDGDGLFSLFLPRRTRSLTTVHTRDSLGNLSLQLTTTYRLKSSLNAAGTAMVEGRKLDELAALPGLSTGCWPYGANTIQLVGRFGWAAVPDDIKRLVALRVYDVVKATADPLTSIQQRTTVDAVTVFGESVEIADIERRYRRDVVMVG